MPILTALALSDALVFALNINSDPLAGLGWALLSVILFWGGADLKPDDGKQRLYSRQAWLALATQLALLVQMLLSCYAGIHYQALHLTARTPASGFFWLAGMNTVLCLWAIGQLRGWWRPIR